MFLNQINAFYKLQDLTLITESAKIQKAFIKKAFCYSINYYLIC